MSKLTSASKLSLFFIILTLLLSFQGCDKQQDYIPYVTVNFTLSINPDLANVGIMGHYIKQDAGVSGVIIFRRDLDVYEAYDLTCTYLPYEQKCKINLDKTGLLPVCPCCSSEFNLVNYANPSKGPAVRPLQQYHVSITGNFLQVTN